MATHASRPLLRFILGLALLGGSLCSTPAAQPNVIIILTDDQGYGELSCHGNPILQTPHLDRLHAESIRFTDFHVAPMCTPTRGQLMTGVDSLRNRAMNVSSGRTLLRRDLPTMADLFAHAGYATGLFGKWHLGDNYPYRPQDRGFQESLCFPSSHISSAPDFWENDYFDDTYLHHGQRRAFTGYTTDVFFQEAIRWMQSQSRAHKPFLCYLPTAAPHGPLFVPPHYRQALEKAVAEADLPDLNKAQRANLARYLAMIANLDENVGRLESFLRQSGLRDNTLLLFMTDNGSTFGPRYFNAGMRGGKVTLWEGGHRVPCFFRWPGGHLRAPGDVPGLTQVQDILPTLLDLCQIHPARPVAFDGISLGEVLRGQAEPPAHRTLVVQFSRMDRPAPPPGDACVMWQRWRLVQDQELYNLAQDPAQQHNVIADHPEVAAQLRDHYSRWWQSVAPGLHEPQRIVIGHPTDNPTLLSPCEWYDVFLDQSAQVRRGETKNGAWHLNVAQAGPYTFELRRWPREIDVPIPAGLPPSQLADGQLPPGTALPIRQARLRIGTSDQTTNVSPSDKAATFRATLETGPVDLQTWFLDQNGQSLCGAYYVYVEHSPTSPPAEIESRRQEPRHRFVCTDYTQGKVFVVSAQGKVEWEYPAPSCNDLWALPNGNFLFNTGHGVQEVTRDRKIVFDYQSQSEIYACQRLPNGNTFIGECNAGRLLEVAPHGAIVKELRLLPEGQDGGHAFMRNARCLENGHYLVAHYGAQIVKEYDSQGRVVLEIPAAGGPHSVARLANGNTVISCGDLPGGSRVFEVNPEGQTVWQVQGDAWPGISLKFMAGFQRLPNGNTVMCNWLGHGQFGQAPHLIEVTPQKKVVWTFADHQTMRTISNIQILDQPDAQP